MDGTGADAGPAATVVAEITAAGGTAVADTSDVAGEESSAFGLLGRAFEAAQREEKRSFEEGLLAFFRGAMIQREDLEQVLRRMPPQSAH